MGKHTGTEATKSISVPRMLPMFKVHTLQDEMEATHCDSTKERKILSKQVFKAKQKVRTPEKEHSRPMTLVEKRKVANARERTRVHTLSAAFEALRQTIPSFSANQKLSKLTILKVAISYITALDTMNRRVKSSKNNAVEFARHVNECTVMLKSEYGRMNTRNSNVKLKRDEAL
eukprot:Seg1855.3 transcript_id=Seg1855.3/GoldUCD/mRNA.D3Y31 product="Protein atonal 8" protein_id=Seg1855.3/GoldUCD/D3Y31